MKRTLARGLIVLACSVLGPGAANAAPRGPSARDYEATKASRPAEKPEAQQVDMDTWLARMKGNFTIKLVLKGRFTCLTPAGDRTLQTQPCMTEEAARGITFTSAARCPGIGEGPGLYCKFDVLRRTLDENSADDPRPEFLINDPLPILALFGIDPATRKISVMTMNSASVVLSAMGSLKGNTATFDGTCDSALARNRPCKWSLQIDAPSDGGSVVMKRTMQGSTYTFELDRVED